jgi:hypothetical protein
MHLQFKCAPCGKNQENEKNTQNIARGMENTPNFKSWLLGKGSFAKRPIFDSRQSSSVR